MKRLPFFGGALAIAAVVVAAAAAVFPADLIGFESVQSVAQTAVVFAIGTSIGGLVMMVLANRRQQGE